MKTRLLWALVCVACVGSTGALGQVQRAGRLTVDFADITLAEAMERVAAEAPELQYVLWRGDLARVAGTYSADTVDELLDQIVTQCGVDATVVGDLWIIQGAPPDAWRVDARASVHEQLAAQPAILEALVAREQAGPNALPLAEVYRACIADVRVPHVPAGALRCVGVEIAADDPRYADLYAALIATSVTGSGHARMTAAPNRVLGMYSLSIHDDCVALVCTHSGRDAEAPIPLREGAADRDHLASLGPVMGSGGSRRRGWDPVWLLGAPVSLARDAQLSEFLSDLGDVAGVSVSLEGPELDGAVSVRVRDLPVGTALIALATASGLPASTLHPPATPDYIQSERCVLGGRSAVRSHESTRPLDARVAVYTDCRSEVASLVAALDEDERRTLSHSPVRIPLLAPRLRHAVIRWLLEHMRAEEAIVGEAARDSWSIRPSPSRLDDIVERIGRPAPLTVLVSAEGVHSVAAWRGVSGEWSACLLPPTEDPAERLRRLGAWIHVPAAVPRGRGVDLAHPRSPGREPPLGGSDWTARGGPLASPNREGR